MGEVDRDLVEAIAARLQQGRPSPLMSALWDGFWGAIGAQHRSSRDTKGQWARLCLFKLPDGRNLAELHASEVSVDFVLAYRDWRLRQITRRDKAPSPATVNRETDRLRAVLNWAAKHRLIDRNPMSAVTALPEDNVKQTKIRSEAEFEQLLRACDEVHPLLRPLCLAYMDAGLRRLEAQRLRWDELEAKDNGGGRARLAGKRTKNKLPRQPHLTIRTFEALMAIPRVSEWVFANARVFAGGRKGRHYGRPYSPFHLHRLFQKAVQLSGLHGVEGESITWHVLRHSFAYRARRLWKWSELVIMAQGGWKTRKAFERYGIVDDDELNEAMVDAEARIAADRIALTSEPRKPPQRISPVTATVGISTTTSR